MTYAHISAGTVVSYPLYEHEIRARFPNVSFPENFIPPEEYVAIVPVEQPANTLSTSSVEGTPALINGVWTQVWQIVAATTEETAQRIESIQVQVVQGAQLRLDNFARTRNYDGILSASTYATSAVPKFSAEGQCCVDARDATWSTLYTVLAEIQAGTRAMPTSFADIEPLLPVLVWPV